MFYVRLLQISMERIKEFYKKNPGSQIQLGETSRSDMIRRKNPTRHVKTEAIRNSKKAEFFPQPKLAAGHTKGNVCFL